jgi:P27 family predicted phage terminase small subunit
VRLLTGTAPRRVAADLADGVHPPVCVPEPPAHLSPEALGEWQRITPLLLALGLIAEIDRAALTAYCAIWGRLQLVEAALAAEQQRHAAAGQDPAAALVHTTPTGFSREAILSRLAGDLIQQLDRALGAFGLSPAARSRVTASRNTGQQALPGFERSGADRFFGGL